MKKLVGLSFAVLLLTSLTACSINSNSDTPGKQIEPRPSKSDIVDQGTLEFTTQDISDKWDFGEQFEDVPAIAQIKENGFVLLNGASGTCPNVIDTIDMDPQNLITITYKEPDKDRMCTMDFRLYATEINLVNAKINPDEVSFKLVNNKNSSDIPIKN
jgi:hypothetical protein